MNQLTYDHEGRLIVNVDGCCRNNGRQGAQAGYGVFFADYHPWNVGLPVKGRPTNNIAEIQAVTEAALIAKRYGMRRIRIVTDSMFVINCIQKWIPNWLRNGWMTARGEPVINRNELVEMMNALSDMEYVLEHVRGHSGHYGNTQADRLANDGCDAYQN